MKKILLVEDNETIVMGLKYSLEQENFQVISAKSGIHSLSVPLFALYNSALHHSNSKERLYILSHLSFRQKNRFFEAVPVLLQSERSDQMAFQ